MLARNPLWRQFEFAGRSDDVRQIHDDRLVQVRELRELSGRVEGRALVAELDVSRRAVSGLVALVENDEAFTAATFLEPGIVARDALNFLGLR